MNEANPRIKMGLPQKTPEIDIPEFKLPVAEMKRTKSETSLFKRECNFFNCPIIRNQEEKIDNKENGHKHAKSKSKEF